MNKEIRILMSALTVAAYSLVTFTAAGFFYSNYREVLLTCSRFSYSDCQASDSITVSLISLKIGAIVFFLLGSFAWAVASYLAIRWIRMRSVGRLP